MRTMIPVKLYEEGLEFYEIRRFRCKIVNNILKIKGNIRFTLEGKARFKEDELSADIANYDFHIRLCDKDGGFLDITELDTHGPIDSTYSIDLTDTGRLFSSELLDELSFVEIVVDKKACYDLDCDWVHRRRHHGF